MFNYKNTIYALTNQINAAGSDYETMTIFYPNDTVGIYIYYRNNCEFGYTLGKTSPIAYWQGAIYVLNRYLHSTEEERSIA